LTIQAWNIEKFVSKLRELAKEKEENYVCETFVY
jgi:hypothetical protein